MKMDDIHVGDMVAYQRPSVGTYFCRVLAVRADHARPLTLQPLRYGARTVTGRSFTASLARVRGKIPDGMALPAFSRGE